MKFRIYHLRERWHYIVVGKDASLTQQDRVFVPPPGRVSVESCLADIRELKQRLADAEVEIVNSDGSVTPVDLKT